MSDAVPFEDDSSSVFDPSGAGGTASREGEPSTPEGTALISRAELIDRVTDMLRDEGQPHTTARVLATIYATSDELSAMLASLDQAGGLPGMSGILGSLLGRMMKGGKT